MSSPNFETPIIAEGQENFEGVVPVTAVEPVRPHEITIQQPKMVGSQAVAQYPVVRAAVNAAASRNAEVIDISELMTHPGYVKETKTVDFWHDLYNAVN